MAKREWLLTPKQENVYKGLWSQVEKFFDLRSRTGQGIRGKVRYRESLRGFCKFLAFNYGSSNFRNLRDQHLQKYIQFSTEAGVGPATIKNDLSAIRKLHELAGGKNKLSDNERLGYTEKRVRRGVDRAWRDSEVKTAVDVAQSMGRKDVVLTMQLARYQGLRIEEVTALNRTQLKDALRNGYLALTNTKNNIPRDVPLTDNGRKVIASILTHSDPNQQRVFVEHGHTHRQAYRSVQNWIGHHRDWFQESVGADPQYLVQLKLDFERPSLTFHGLRHAYAREQYQQRLGRGMSERTARKEVAELLGHGRDEVTRIYLGQ